MKTADFHVMVIPPMENPPKDALEAELAWATYITCAEHNVDVEILADDFSDALDKILDWSEGRGIDFKEVIANLLGSTGPATSSRSTKVRVELGRI